MLLILVKESDAVRQGQLLMRMEAQLQESDTKMADAELKQWALPLRKINADLSESLIYRPPVVEISRRVNPACDIPGIKRKAADTVGSDNCGCPILTVFQSPCAGIAGDGCPTRCVKFDQPRKTIVTASVRNCHGDTKRSNCKASALAASHNIDWVTLFK